MHRHVCSIFSTFSWNFTDCMCVCVYDCFYSLLFFLFNKMWAHLADLIEYPLLCVDCAFSCIQLSQKLDDMVIIAGKMKSKENESV